MISKVKWLLALIIFLYASLVMAASLRQMSSESTVIPSANLLLYGVLGAKIKQVRVDAFYLSTEGSTAKDAQS